MMDHHQYEKLERGSLENSCSSTSLDTTDEEEDQPEDIKNTTRTKRIVRYVYRRRFTFIGGTIGCLVTITGLALLISHLMINPGNKEEKVMNLLVLEGDPTLYYPNPPHPDGILTPFKTFCGNTSRIARSRGCKFDVMSFAWVPAHCLDTDMMERYISERTWEWYKDYSLTQLATLEEVRGGEYKWMFSSQSYHIAHCIYTWERQKRFLFAKNREDEIWIDQGSFGAHHTTHCIDYILKRNVEPNKVSTIWNGVAECRIADTIGTL